MNDTYLYPYSADEAKRLNELALWRGSHRENIFCRETIEAVIRQGFDGMYLNSDCADKVIRDYGFRRVKFVLANTLQEKNWDGRFSRQNREWFGRTVVPHDARHNCEFVVESHPAVLDGFMDQYRQAYQALGLFEPAQCEPDSRSELDYTGRVLVLSPDALKESCWSPENQLWLAHDGFGCSPRTIGRSIRCTCLGDGEMTRWNRTDFVGVLKEEHLPDWAMEKLAELRGQEQANGPAMGGMTMKG